MLIIRKCLTSKHSAHYGVNYRVSLSPCSFRSAHSCWGDGLCWTLQLWFITSSGRWRGHVWNHSFILVHREDLLSQWMKTSFHWHVVFLCVCVCFGLTQCSFVLVGKWRTNTFLQNVEHKRVVLMNRPLAANKSFVQEEPFNRTLSVAALQFSLFLLVLCGCIATNYPAWVIGGGVEGLGIHWGHWC